MSICEDVKNPFVPVYPVASADSGRLTYSRNLCNSIEQLTLIQLLINRQDLDSPTLRLPNRKQMVERTQSKDRSHTDQSDGVLSAYITASRLIRHKDVKQ